MACLLLHFEIDSISDKSGASSNLIAFVLNLALFEKKILKIQSQNVRYKFTKPKAPFGYS